MYKIKSPVLFIIFNRPDCTSKVFEEIKKGKPEKLYISADGPRDSNFMDFELCRRAKEVLKIDWDCQVKTLYQEKNLGCKKAVSTGIKWFFENELEGIILEDDCLPNQAFFRFCDLLLEKYRDDSRIVHISGTKINIDKEFGNATYYFSKYTNIWGWASWRRVWKHYDENLSLLDDFINEDIFQYVYERADIREFLTKSLQKTAVDEINTWDYQYAFLNFWNNGLCICPNFNLISNIGFNEDATHTTNPHHIYANLPHQSLDEIIHPRFFLPRLDADYLLLDREIPSRFQKNILIAKGIVKRILKYINGIIQP